MSNNYRLFQSFDGGQTWVFVLATKNILFFELFALTIYFTMEQGMEMNKYGDRIEPKKNP